MELFKHRQTFLCARPKRTRFGLRTAADCFVYAQKAPPRIGIADAVSTQSTAAAAACAAGRPSIARAK